MATTETTHQPINSQAKPDRFLVCGLGSLGQHCVVVLKEFGVKVSAIDAVQPQNWEIPGMPDLLEEFLIGDCRQPHILEQAEIRQCRAVLLVTSDERVNLEAAFAARLLNPHIYLVVRSAKQNLNELLDRHLGNFVAYEPTQLSASAFALAAIGNQTLGFFKLEEHLLRVVKYQIRPHDPWCDRWLVHGLNTRSRRVLSYTPHASHRAQQQFYQWQPDARVRAGDTMIWIEVAQASHRAKPTPESRRVWQHWWGLARNLTWKSIQRQIFQVWTLSAQHQIRRVAILCGITVLVLLLSGTLLYGAQYPDISLRDAFFVTANLLLGGYGDLFGQLKLTIPTPWGLQLFSLGLSLIGTAFIGVLYALLTENLLTSRFHFLGPRPPVPQQDHVVLIGLGRVGQRIAALLQELKQPIVGITETSLDLGTLPQMPLIVGNFSNALAKASLASAKSVVVVTNDELTNLEIGLMALAANPTANLVIRAVGSSFNDLARLFPHAQALFPDALAAEAFAAAAFGENVLSLFRLNNQTILVMEYAIEAGDTLNGLILAEVAYGYGVVPILYQKYQEGPSKLMPADDIQLQVGDRLVVLATINSLQHIERGELEPRRWQVQVEKVGGETRFEGAYVVSRVVGCPIPLARKVINHCPGTLPLPLYEHQAHRLVQEFSKVKILAHQVPMDNDRGDGLPNAARFRS